MLETINSTSHPSALNAIKEKGRQGKQISLKEITSALSFQCTSCRKAEEGLCVRGCSDRVRGNVFKLKESRFRLDITETIFTVRVVRPCPRLPREAVGAPSLEVFKARLDGAWSNLVWQEVGLELDDP